MFGILGKQFYREWGVNTLLSLCFVTLIVCVLQFGNLFSLFLADGNSAKNLLWGFLLIIPCVMVVALPLSFMMGLVLLFSRWTREREWLALSSSGVGKWRILQFILPVAIFLTLLGLLISNFVVPQSLKLAEKKFLSSNSELIISKIKEGQIVRLFDVYQLYVARKISESEWQDPFLIMESKEGSLSIRAENGKLINDTDGLRLSFLNGTLESDSALLNLNGKFNRFSMKISPAGTNRDLSSFLAYKSLTFGELEGSLQNCQGSSCFKIEQEKFRRISMSFAGLFFCLFALVVHGSKIIVRLPPAVMLVSLVATIYYFSDRFGGILVEKGVIPAFWGYWLAVIGLVVTICLILIGNLFRR